MLASSYLDSNIFLKNDANMCVLKFTIMISPLSELVQRTQLEHCRRLHRNPRTRCRSSRACDGSTWRLSNEGCRSRRECRWKVASILSLLDVERWTAEIQSQKIIGDHSQMMPSKFWLFLITPRHRRPPPSNAITQLCPRLYALVSKNPLQQPQPLLSYII